ncbi:MAG: TetR/AcrR family transcriptional regulator [Ilumatobacteraceae bacterium]
MRGEDAALTPRAVRTRTALVQAARFLFETRGYLDTNVGDVAVRARVAHGTFYTYFSSKEEIFREVAREFSAEFQAVADSEPPLSPGASLRDRIARTNRGYLRAYQQFAPMMAVLEQVATFNPRLLEIRRETRRLNVERNAAAFRRWQQRGLIDDAIDPVYAASALGSMVDRSAYVWIVLGEPYDLDTAVDQLTTLYCNALGLAG